MREELLNLTLKEIFENFGWNPDLIMELYIEAEMLPPAENRHLEYRSNQSRISIHFNY